MLFVYPLITITVSRGLTGHVFVTPSWPKLADGQEKTPLSNEEILRRNRVGDPSFQGRFLMQWAPQLKYINTDIKIDDGVNPGGSRSHCNTLEQRKKWIRREKEHEQVQQSLHHICIILTPLCLKRKAVKVSFELCIAPQSQLPWSLMADYSIRREPGRWRLSRLLFNLW